MKSQSLLVDLYLRNFFQGLKHGKIYKKMNVSTFTLYHAYKTKQVA
jgi:hypothetical protein